MLLLSNKAINTNKADCRSFNYQPQRHEWSEAEWKVFNAGLFERALAAPTETKLWHTLVRGARHVLRNYSTSFFIVTRFLPVKKRQQVEAIYAAVRYPDEIVDTFRITPEEKLRVINDWQQTYDRALQGGTQRELLMGGIPPILVAFTKVVNDASIPHHLYRSFLDAMRLDIYPVQYATLDDLINSYIYGSAIVVGYFLAYVYGPENPEDRERMMDASRELGIALQLTNFMRDVSDDRKRTRVYLPIDMLRRAGLDLYNVFEASSHEQLTSVIRDIVEIADGYYASAQTKIAAFSADCRTAIQACIDVYRQLNDQIRVCPLIKRHSVPLSKKFKVLPTSKYWRLPVAYLFSS